MLGLSLDLLECALRLCALGHDRDAKIAEKYLLVLPDQHVLWLDVAVDETGVVGVLQPGCDLLDVGDSRLQIDDRSSGMMVAVSSHVERIPSLGMVPLHRCQSRARV